MSITIAQLALYASALFILVITPGPVWVAIIARSLSGGFQAAWPLALGVAFGDLLWPLVAIFGISAIVAVFADFLLWLRYVAAVMLIGLGIGIIRYDDAALSENPELARPGRWAGFLAGFLAVTANPKASLFYLGLLPGFFDMSQVQVADIIAICCVSFTVPFLGNMAIVSVVGPLRKLLASPEQMRRVNIGAGVALIIVGFVVALLG